MLHIGEVIKQLMERKNKSIADVSKDLVIAHSRISEYVNKKSKPTPKRLKVLADYFGVEVSEMRAMQNMQKKTDTKVSVQATIEFNMAFVLQSLAELDSKYSNRGASIILGELTKSYDDSWTEHLKTLK